MKRIEELGISPMPWVYSKDIGAILSDAHGVVYDELMLANDARLISAAPELYEALRIAYLHMIGKYNYQGNEAEKFRSALAKASGKEQK